MEIERPHRPYRLLGTFESPAADPSVIHPAVLFLLILTRLEIKQLQFREHADLFAFSPKLSTKEREVDFEELDFADLTPAILAAPPPVAENKRTMIAHGWMGVVSEDLEVSNCSRHKSPVIHYMAY